MNTKIGLSLEVVDNAIPSKFKVNMMSFHRVSLAKFWNQRARRSKLAMSNQRGAAVSEPQGDEVGSRRVTNIVNLGFSAGAKPMKLAMVLSSS